MLDKLLLQPTPSKLSKKIHSRQFLIASVLASSLLLTACVPLLVGSAAVGVVTVVNDRRPAAMQANDKKISIYADSKAAAALPSGTSRVNAMTFNHRVLLTGEVASEEDKQIVGQEVREIDGVTDVVNQLVVGPVANFSTRSNDTWISTKVRTDLLASSGIPSGTILTTTSQGVVYLMGQVTAQESDAAANAAAGVAGVTRVVKVFDVGDTSDRASSGSQSSTTTNSTSTDNPTSSGETKTFPLTN